MSGRTAKQTSHVRGGRPKLAGQWTAARQRRSRMLAPFGNRHTRVLGGMPAASEPGFVHLRALRAYSLLEGALTIARLAELAKADRQPALALTDTDNMFGALEFSEKMAGAGIQPIVGCALGVDFGDQESTARAGGRARHAAHRAAGRARGGLPQPDAAQLARLSRNAAERAAAHQARLARAAKPTA